MFMGEPIVSQGEATQQSREAIRGARGAEEIAERCDSLMGGQGTRDEKMSRRIAF